MMTADERNAFCAPFADHIREVVDNAPPLPDDAVDLLRRLGLGRRPLAQREDEQVAS